MLAAVQTNVLLTLLVFAARGEAASQGGVLLNLCYTGNVNASLQVQNVNSGLVLAQSVVETRPEVIFNTPSSSLDRTRKKFALGTNGLANDNRVSMYSYSSTSTSLDKNCTAPLTTFASNTQPGDVHCVVYSEGRLFAVYDVKFGNGMVSEVMDNCSFTVLATSPKRVLGSVNGPGGRCVSVPAAKKIVWMEDRTNILVVFDYVQKNFTTLAIA